jgi:hypothetical protein
MYVSRNVVALSCRVKERVLSVCTVGLHVTVSNVKMLSDFMGKYVAGNNGTYLCCHVKCPIFSSKLSKYDPNRRVVKLCTNRY